MNECHFPAAGMTLIVLWLCGFSVFKDYFSSSHEGVWMRGSLRSSQVLWVQVILTIKNLYEITPLEVVVVGAQGKRVPPAWVSGTELAITSACWLYMCWSLW